MRVSKKNHVAREYEITVAGAAIEQNVEVYLLGDINQDGNVALSDVKRLLSHVKGTSLLGSPETNNKIGDINQDGNVTLTDVKRLLSHVKGTSLLY